LASDAKIKLEMEYQVSGSTIVKKSFGTLNVSTLDKRGLWIVFKQEKDLGFPGIVFGGNLIFCNDPVERMDNLKLVVSVIKRKTKVIRKTILFSETRPMGSRAPTRSNIYHLLVLDNFIDQKTPPQSLNIRTTHYEPWKAAFFRTHRLAMNYAVRSDEQTRHYEDAFNVKARFTLPRLILVAEEWLDLPEEIESKSTKKSGTLFGGNTGKISNEISGENRIRSQYIPIYSMDILLDSIEATGDYPNGFQTARSVRNDILEGEIFFHSAGGKRRIITATTVFSQMQKNRISKNSGNRILTVNNDNIMLLDNCEHLWPDAKNTITSFLNGNKEWRILIPEKPVTFYSEEEPLYALYAWYQVHPQSGRMVGVLPNNMRGAISDEIAVLQKGLLNKPQPPKPEADGESASALFSHVAGKVVASARILDTTGLTIMDPSVSDLNEKEWMKFLTGHSLYFCQKFLEDNADLYDAYTSRIGFWQGAILITRELGGAQAARECAYKAGNSLTNKAIFDTKNFVEEKFKRAKKPLSPEMQKAMEDELDKHSKDLKNGLNALKKVNDYYGQEMEWEKKSAEYISRYAAAMDHLKSGFAGNAQP